MGMTEKIKMAMIKQGIRQKELAEALGISQPTLSGKFKLDDWRESDIKAICDILGVEFKAIIQFEDGTEL